MILNFKVLPLIFLLFCGSIWAQQSNGKAPEQNTESSVGIFSFGAYFASPFGNNFVNQGIDLKPGFQIILRGNVVPRITLGINYSLVRGKVINKQVTGNYDTAQIRVLGGMLGYEFPIIPKFGLELLGGFAQVVHKNELGDIVFKDRGFTLWLAPEISWSFTKSIALYAAPELRYDHMNIDVPESLKSSFKNVGYFSVGAGVRFRL